ncbi:MAG: hypothetical protein A3H50_02450 [Candidatus Levybacteria bacterium RIFCSPLOWO2_02_FULL_37_10]|nr:MAG: hypothetical protein A2860_04445 [Candidatus Levybacteria bacterium RIFCSPHIGHO2_01_FULL_37_33]OGH17469.1 MAG: hypothetical protein A3C97_02250 [Candidatus Levybacteria bacterium RIFCSPHIGHO2_02_FULL_37_11]OGH33173.1 MAG: hypothetical protein A2953_02660 [Candidatus Levybacteria bacterium RIFCSPLOWO2_01_FULL_36_54]OGH46061.1 MAG: hypothetical protein A3H50_02450 [Candidatus Levybacteria bacterium RIFCSPLOWO2_02_FULL_37_10]
MAKKRYSRLSRRLESQSRKNLFLSILGIIVVLFLLVKFGIPLLVNFSLFLSGQKKDEPSKNASSSYLSPPVLNQSANATNSAEFIITGTASKDEVINLYVNDSLSEKEEVEDNGNFSFKISLKTGDNKIKAKAAKGDKESDFSNELVVTYRNIPPSLSVDSPTDGQKFEKDQSTARVSGKTDSGVKITVNGFWAVIDENNSFSYNLPLQNGDNTIKIEAVDQAGNKAEKEIKVTYSP